MWNSHEGNVDVRGVRERDCEPHRHMMVDLSREKFNLRLIHLIVVLYGQLYLSDIRKATVFSCMQQLQ